MCPEIWDGMNGKLNLSSYLSFAVRKAASDIHFRIGTSPTFRIRGDLINLKTPPLTEAAMMEICAELLAKSGIACELSHLQEKDGSFELDELGRFRFNIFRTEGRLGVVLRVIPVKIATIDDLGLPPVLKKIALIERGFVLVTGATGQGKTTTLAALVDYLNRTRKAHIITIEDPIEFVHLPKQSKITQREVGRDTPSFAHALRAALRQDPDVILVGEMRDAESLDIALKAAETGHLVFSTVHTTDSAKTIGRIISMCPAEEQLLVRLRLADCLKAVISQRLLVRADGNGRVVAQEIMITNTAIAECITDPMRTSEIPIFIQNANTLLGSQTFHMHLAELYRKGLITLETAKHASNNPSDFEIAINYDKADSHLQEGPDYYKGLRSINLDGAAVTLESPPVPMKSEEGSEESDEGLITKVWNTVSRKAK